MCMSDWRLGRLIRTVGSFQTVANAGTMVIGTNRDRVGIIISIDVSSTASVTRVSIDVDGLRAMSLSTTNPQVIYTLASHGDLPTRQFTMTAQGTGFNIGVLELIAPEKMIDAAIEEFVRKRQW